MFNIRRKTLPLLALLTLLAPAAPLLADEPATQPAAHNRDKTGFAPPKRDPADQAKQYKSMYGQMLDASDDEIAVILPRIEKLQSLRMEMGGYTYVPPDPNAKPADKAPEETVRMEGNTRIITRNISNPTTMKLNDIGLAMKELRDAIKDKDASPDFIRKKIDAVHQAREKLRAEYRKADKDLRDILNARQEGLLMAQGTID